MTAAQIEAVEKELETLMDLKEEMIESGTDIIADYSYCDSGTGYRAVREYKFSPEYIAVLDRIQQLLQIPS